MKRPHYDKRMHLWDNWRYQVWRPFICSLKGHNVTCYGITPCPRIITGYVYICSRCVKMEDHPDPCGQCNNGCKPEEDEGGLKVRR